MNRGVLYNILSVAIMSMSPLINKFSLGYINSTKAAFFNTLFGVLFCVLFSKFKNQKIQTVKNKGLILIGLLNAAGVICLYVSIDMLGPIMVGFLGRFYIVFTILFSILIFRERIKKGEMVVIAIAIIGAFLFSAPDSTVQSGFGAALAILYTFLFALTNMLVKIKIKDIDSNSILFYNNAISLVFIFVYGVCLGELSTSGFQWQGIGFIFVSSLFSSFIGLLLFYEGLKYLDFSKANIIRSTSPLLTAMYAWPFFPILLTYRNGIGAMLLFGSIVWLAWTNSKQATQMQQKSMKGS